MIPWFHFESTYIRYTVKPITVEPKRFFIFCCNKRKGITGAKCDTVAWGQLKTARLSLYNGLQNVLKKQVLSQLYVDYSLPGSIIIHQRFWGNSFFCIYCLFRYLSSFQTELNAFFPNFVLPKRPRFDFRSNKFDIRVKLFGIHFFLRFASHIPLLAVCLIILWQKKTKRKKSASKPGHVGA